MKSIKSKLLIFITLLSVIIIFSIGYFTYSKSVEHITDNFYNETSRLTIQVENTLDNFFTRYEEGLDLISHEEHLLAFFNERERERDMFNKFQDFLNVYDSVNHIYFGSKDGGMFLEPFIDVGNDFDPRERPWYEDAVEADGIIWTSPYYDPVNDNMTISVAKPIYDANNIFTGVLSIDIDMDYVLNMISDIQIGESGYVFIADKEGTTLIHNNTDLIDETIPVEALYQAVTSEDEGMVEYTYNDSERLSVFTTLDRLGWVVAATIEASEISGQTQEILYFTLGIGLFVLSVSVIIAFFFANSITKGINHIRELMSNVKEGNFDVKAHIKSKDELKELGDDFNTMISNISVLLNNTKEVVQKVTWVSEELANASNKTKVSAEQIETTIEQITIGATEQAHDTEQGVQLIEELSNNLDDLSDNNNSIGTKIKEILSLSRKGNEVVMDLGDKNESNNTGIIKIEQAIFEMNKKTSEITTIIESIKSIAGQTNLLALNASIEAARAGEHGKGFAVVAEEIRQLAEEAQQSADNISTIIVSVKDESEHSVKVMHEVKEISSNQSNAVDNVKDTFHSLDNYIEGVTHSINQSNQFLDDLLSKKDGIVKAIENISAVSEETAASTEEINASMEEQTDSVEEVANQAENLNMLSDQLKKQINQFKVKK
ncbi:methyl-accepting chemotaxis protein [Natranaerovirga hydrolytica]|uniref:methyl-accepting chemotaxis protein n=1 Tax=Natranaerovirga hydrolytica TaxID=680378 RepID=UPI00104A4709|nr:methyl-accepting chemotaxis protein [Natranaerovirga hydrolytica]